MEKARTCLLETQQAEEAEEKRLEAERLEALRQKAERERQQKEEEARRQAQLKEERRRAEERRVQEEERRERQQREAAEKERQMKEAAEKERQMKEQQEREKLMQQQQQQQQQQREQQEQQSQQQQSTQQTNFSGPAAAGETLPPAATHPFVSQALEEIAGFRRREEAQGPAFLFKDLSEAEAKQTRLTIKARINAALNQIASTHVQVITAIETLRGFVNGPLRTELPQGSEAFFCMELAKRLLALCDKGGQLSVRPSSVWAYAYLVRGVATHAKDFEAIFRGAIFSSCTYAVPFSHKKLPGMSAEAFHRLRGQWAVESEADFFERMSSTLRLWIAHLVCSQKVDELWRWGARFLNLLCSSSTKAGRIAPTLLLEFLETGGHAACQRFKGQFVKLMDVVKETVLPRLEALRQKNPEGISAATTRLALLVQEFYAKGLVFAEPEGKQMKQRESEICQDV